MAAAKVMKAARWRGMGEVLLDVMGILPPPVSDA